MPFNQRMEGRPRKIGAIGEFGPSMTKQSMAKETDVNVIVSRFIQTGDATIFNQRMSAGFLDVTNVGTFQECQDRLQNAAEAFATLPAKIRDAFGNDPNAIADAMRDPAREDQLRELGIFVPKPAQTAQDGAGATKE